MIHHHSIQARHGQRGFSLLLVLILLIVASLLGIAIVRSTAMQERMSANLRDRSLAFQGAESALRYAQDKVLGTAPVATAPTDTWDKKAARLTAADCTSFGICDARKGKAMAAVWKPMPAGSYDSKLAAAPEYSIEYIGTGPGTVGACDNSAGNKVKVDCLSPMFRVTGRSRAAGRAEVVLQAVVGSVIPRG